MLSKKDLLNLEGLFMLYAVKISDGKVMAAKNMNTSIDTLNKYLEILEHEMGSRLISVNDRRCSLTRYGEKVFSIAEQIVKTLKQAYTLKEKEKAVKGEVRIACNRALKPILSNKSLESFLDKYSDISLSIDVFDSLKDIGFNDYDLCLSCDFPHDENLIVLLSKESPCGFFVSNNYLANHAKPQSLEDVLQNHRLILNRNWLKILQFDTAKSAKNLCLSNSTLVVSEMITSGGGIGIIPLRLAKKSPDLVCLNQIKCNINSKIYLLSHRETKDIPRIRVVIDYYKKLLENF